MIKLHPPYSIGKNQLMTLQRSGFDDYLYSTESGLIDFVIVETELRNLNDYAVGILEYTHDELRNHQQRFDKYRATDETEVPDLPEGGLGKNEVYTSDEMMFAMEDVLTWSKNLGFVTPAMILVMLHILTEKSLKALCYSFSEGEGEYEIPADTRFKVPVRSGESSIDANIRWLKDECHFEFDVESGMYDLLDKCREIRNNFAHGDWSVVQKKLQEIELVDAFSAVSKLFSSIDKGMPEP